MNKLLLLLCYIYPAISSNPSVIIVGAGPSGIAAASRLIENGITNVKVLEAEDRIGGRVNSVKFGNAYVDVGAEFCHGQKDNIVYEMVKDLGLLDPGPPFFRVLAYDSKGEKIDPVLVLEIMEFVFMDLDHIAEDYSASFGIDPETMSLGDYVLQIYNSTILKKYKKDEEKLEVLRNAINLIEKMHLSQDSAPSWFEAAAKDHYVTAEGDQGMTWRGHGYKIILDILMKAYPESEEKLDINFITNKKVTKIAWDRSRINVECSDDSAYAADHIIVTPSVGVLKAHHKTLFLPQLPRWKQEAIGEIGFGGVMKIILHFRKKWWPDNFISFAFIWTQEDMKRSGRDFPYGIRKDGVSWVTQVYSMMKSANNSNVLIAWVTGSWVPDIEQIDEHVMKNGITFIVKKFLGKDFNVTEPDKMIHSSWCNNPHFLGTYSFETPESRVRGVWNQKQLMRPLNNSRGEPLVMFAGEATNPIHFSTVHGAIESGQREADRILDLYGKSKN